MNAPLERAARAPALAQRRFSRTPVSLRIIGGLLILIAVGTILFSLPGISTTRRLTLVEALFTSVSSVCVTGLTIITPATDLTFFGQLVMILLIQLGGVGFMVLAVVILRALHRSISLLDRLALRESLGLPEREAFAPILRRVLLSVFFIEGFGSLLLWWTWRSRLGEGTALWYGIFHSISSFCNAGVDLFTGLPEYPLGIPHDWQTLTTLGVIIVLGGLGFPVLADVVTWRRTRRLSLHSRLTLLISVALIVIGAVGIFVAESSPSGNFRELDFAQRLLFSTFQSISSRTAGFSVFGNLDNMTAASQMLIIALMFIGTGPASMGGGITTGTLVVLIVSVWSFARGLSRIQVGDRVIPAEAGRRAGAVLTVSLIVVSIATWVLLLSQPGTFQQALFEIVSAFATTGLTLNYTPMLNPFGLFIVMLMMIWGRLGALTIILALGRRRPPDLVSYPEEQVLIG